MMEDPPKLTLYNFDDPCYDNCNYVLTSPRSLEACSKIGVKPVDLLYSPPTDHGLHLCRLLHPGTFCSSLYNEQENLRQLKLKLCLEERNRILKKEQQQEMLKTDSRETIFGSFFNNHQMDPIYSSRADNKSLYQFHEYPKMAWMERNYSDRFSRFKFEERVKELREESMKLRQDLRCREKNLLLNTMMKSAVESSQQSSALSSPKRESLLSSLEKKSASLHSCSSRKEKLASRSKGHLKLSPKDQKILEVMKNRREDERACCQRRQMLHHQWQKEKNQEEMVKNTLENIRRKMIRGVANLQSEKSLNEIWEEESKKLEDMDATTQPDDGSITHRGTDQLLEELIKKEEERVRIRSRRKQKKKHQEEKLQDLTQEEELMKKMLQEKQESDIQRALQKKQTMVAENVAKMKKINSERYTKYLTQKEMLTTQERDVCVNLSQALEQQQGQVMGNLEKLTNERVAVQTYKRKVFDKRLERSRNLKHQEKEKWCGRKAVEELVEEQRVQIHTCSAIMKAQKAREDRLHREISHASNMKRINEYIELWKEKTAEHLSEKVKRLEEIQAAREQQMNEARASAHHSMILRNKLRQHYDPNNFDKKLLEAELYIKMGSGIQTAAKNLSSFSLN